MNNGAVRVRHPSGAAAHVQVAGSFWPRLFGLMGTQRPPPQLGLLIQPCNSIHTAFMRYPLGLIWLDTNHRIVRMDDYVPPWSMRLCWKAAAVIETSVDHPWQRLCRLGQHLDISFPNEASS